MDPYSNERHIEVDSPSDPDKGIRAAYEWLVSQMPPDDWVRRKEAVEDHIRRAQAPVRSLGDARPQSIIPAFDRIAWYLWLAEQDHTAPWRFDPVQSARILPVLRRFGTDLDLLLIIGGIEKQAQHLLDATTEPDAALFEMLIALLWKRNGYKDVAFIPRRKKVKTPDIKADHWTIETKRISAMSDYSLDEHKAWTEMWSRFKYTLIRGPFPYVIDIVFHVELATLDADVLVRELSTKLKLITPPTELIANDTWNVRVAPVDFGRIHAHFARNYVKRVVSPNG